jgi:hypothetical protein
MARQSWPTYRRLTVCHPGQTTHDDPYGGLIMLKQMIKDVRSFVEGKSRSKKRSKAKLKKSTAGRSRRRSA